MYWLAGSVATFCDVCVCVCVWIKQKQWISNATESNVENFLYIYKQAELMALIKERENSFS